MYNCRIDLKKLSIIGIVALLGLQSQAFGIDFDLTKELASQFNKDYKGGLSDKYISRNYSSSFSKNPFGDAMTNVEDMSMQLKVSGIDYVKGALAEKNCSLDDEKIWAILYYYVPEFRAELVRTLKMNMRDYDSKIYTYDWETIYEYCKEYFECESNLRGGESETRGISANTAQNVDANCKEFFQLNYREGQANGKRIQNTQMAQIGSDRYRNETTKDSPYDIMVDLGIYSQLLYQDAEDPEKPVFYDLDTFNESKSSLIKQENSDGKKFDNGREKRVKANGGVIFPNWNQGGGAGGSNGGGGGGGGMGALGSNNGIGGSLTLDEPNHGSSASLGGLLTQSSNEVNLGGLTRSDSNGTIGGTMATNQVNAFEEKTLELGEDSPDDPAPLPLYGEGGYDSLVDGLSSITIKSQTPSIEGSLCGDDEEPEPEGEDLGDGGAGGGMGANLLGKGSRGKGETPNLTEREFSELSNQEYQDLVDYMTRAVDEYADLPEDREKEMDKKAGDTSSYVGDSDSGQLSNSANKIKNCWKSCNDLRIDLKATCMMKCACGHIDSPIFDPEKTEGLGPLFVIRYCSVPSTDTKFSKGGKRIHSIEEGIKEIYGAVDKLSREGRLGIWTQQYNFLDSSTKKMKIADSFAFTIDVEFVDLADKMGTHSDQYQKKKLKDDNRSWQSDNEVVHSLDDPSAKNAYRTVGTLGESVGDYSAGANSDMNRKVQADLDKTPKPMIDPIDNTDAYRYNMFASHMGRFMDQQGTFWIDASNYQSEMSSYAAMLYAKEKRRANDARSNKSE